MAWPERTQRSVMMAAQLTMTGKAIVATDVQEHIIFQHGSAPAAVEQLLSGTPDALQVGGDYVSAWTPSIIEGTVVGKVMFQATR